MTGFSARQGFLAGFVICLGLMAGALYLQHVQGLEPCPLCIFQRIVFIAMMLLFLAAAIHAPGRGGARAYAALIAVSGLVGVGIAIRHLFIQFGPAQKLASCGADLNYMLENFPLSETLALVFKGEGDCAEAGWSFLGLTLPAWSLVWFVLLAALAIVSARRASARY